MANTSSEWDHSRHAVSQHSFLRLIHGLGDLYTKYIGGSKHVGHEDDHLHVGSEANVGFERVVVLRHVHKLLRAEDAGNDEVRLGDAYILNDVLDRNLSRIDLDRANTG